MSCSWPAISSSGSGRAQSSLCRSRDRPSSPCQRPYAIGPPISCRCPRLSFPFPSCPSPSCPCICSCPCLASSPCTCSCPCLSCPCRPCLGRGSRELLRWTERRRLIRRQGVSFHFSFQG